MFLLPPSDFWLSHANIADYGLDVRGDDPIMYAESTGTTGTATGREAFAFLSSLRAFGTFGDPLAMGFALCAPFLLLAFIYRKRWFTVPVLAVLAVAIFFTFDRSVWIFLFIVGLITLFQRRKYKWLIGFASVPVVMSSRDRSTKNCHGPTPGRSMPRESPCFIKGRSRIREIFLEKG
jgi:hypothetical protein